MFKNTQTLNWWTAGLDWIYLRTLLLLEHLVVLINWRDPSPPIRDYVIYERPLMVKPEPHRKLSKVCIHSIYKTRSLSYFLRNLMRYFQLFHPVKSAWSALKKEACINLLKTPTFPASTSYNMLEQALHTTLVLS